jgi:hypothetical protein
MFRDRIMHIYPHIAVFPTDADILKLWDNERHRKRSSAEKTRQPPKDLSKIPDKTLDRILRSSEFRKLASIKEGRGGVERELFFKQVFSGEKFSAAVGLIERRLGLGTLATFEGASLYYGSLSNRYGKREGRMVCAFLIKNHQDFVELLSLAASRSGQGHGKRAVQELKKFGKPVVLYSCRSALSFYEKLGFQLNPPKVLLQRCVVFKKAVPCWLSVTLLYISVFLNKRFLVCTRSALIYVLC